MLQLGHAWPSAAGGAAGSAGASGSSTGTGIVSPAWGVGVAEASAEPSAGMATPQVSQ